MNPQTFIDAAEREGREARLKNVPLLSNPYVGEPFHSSWERGWMKENAALRTGED